MPPKKRDDKRPDQLKQKELPLCNTWIVHLSFHPVLNFLQKHFKPKNMKLFTNEDIQNLVRDSGQDPTAANFAQLLKQQIQDLELPLRQAKQDKQEAVTEEQVELIIILKDFPTTPQEVEALYEYDLHINQTILLRPSLRVLKLYKESNQEGEELSQYTQSFLTYQDIAMKIHQIVSKTELVWKIIPVDIFEEPESDEPKEEVKEDPKKKDAKGKKVQEVKQEVIDPNDPKLLIIQEAMQEMEQVSNKWIQYQNWIKTVNLKPFETRNETLDIRQFLKYTQEVPSHAATPLFLISCMNMYIKGKSQLSEDETRAFSEIFHKKASGLSERAKEDSFLMLNENDAIQMTAGKLVFSSTRKYITKEQFEVNKAFNFDGIDRQGMPADSNFAESGAKLTELLSFTTLPRSEFDRALIIKDFEDMLKKNQPERKQNLSDRKYEENLNISQFRQLLENALGYDPDIVTQYSEDRDCMYVAVSNKTPPGRILRKQWSLPWIVAPNFMWSLIDEKSLQQNQFLDIPCEKVGKIMARTKAMYPSDNSLIKMTRYLIGSRKPGDREHIFQYYSSGIAFKDNVYFGLRNTGDFWSRHSDQKYMVEMTEEGGVLNISTSEVHVKIYPDGNILLKRHQNEEFRVLALRGHVIRYLNDSTVLYTPNSEVSTRSKDRIWTVVNSTGHCMIRREVDKALFNKESIPVHTQIDPESLAEITTRPDLVMSVKHTDGSSTVYFPDSTKIHNSTDKNIVNVVSDGYPSVRYRFDPIKARQHTIIGIGSADSGLGSEDIMLRSHDGLVTEVILHTGTHVSIFQQKQEAEGLDMYAQNQIAMLYREDGTVYKVQSDGEVILITGECRTKLAQQHGESAYFYEMFSIAEERSSGVYTTYTGKGPLWTHDSEGNHFEIFSDGRAIEKLAVSLTVDEEIRSPDISDGEFIEEECKFLPPPSTVIPPRLFKVSNNEVKEFLSREQLQEQFRICQEYSNERDGLKFHTWVRSNKVQDRDFKDSPFLVYKLPNLLLPSMQTSIPNEVPTDVEYAYRRIIEHPELTEEKREEFYDNLGEFERAKREKENEREALKFNDVRSEEYREKQMEALKRFLQESGRLQLLEKLVPQEENKQKATESSDEEFLVDLEDENNFIEVSLIGQNF